MSAIDQVEFAVAPEGLRAVGLASRKRHSIRRFMPTRGAHSTDFRGL